MTAISAPTSGRTLASVAPRRQRTWITGTWARTTTPTRTYDPFARGTTTYGRVHRAGLQRPRNDGKPDVRPARKSRASSCSIDAQHAHDRSYVPDVQKRVLWRLTGVRVYARTFACFIVPGMRSNNATHDASKTRSHGRCNASCGVFESINVRMHTRMTHASHGRFFGVRCIS